MNRPVQIKVCSFAHIFSVARRRQQRVRSVALPKEDCSKNNKVWWHCKKSLCGTTILFLKSDIRQQLLAMKNYTSFNEHLAGVQQRLNSRQSPNASTIRFVMDQQGQQYQQAQQTNQANRFRLTQQGVTFQQYQQCMLFQQFRLAEQFRQVHQFQQTYQNEPTYQFQPTNQINYFPPTHQGVPLQQSQQFQQFQQTQRTEPTPQFQQGHLIDLSRRTQQDQSEKIKKIIDFKGKGKNFKYVCLMQDGSQAIKNTKELKNEQALVEEFRKERRIDQNRRAYKKRKSKQASLS